MKYREDPRLLQLTDTIVNNASLFTQEFIEKIKAAQNINDNDKEKLEKEITRKSKLYINSLKGDIVTNIAEIFEFIDKGKESGINMFHMLTCGRRSQHQRLIIGNIINEVIEHHKTLGIQNLEYRPLSDKEVMEIILNTFNGKPMNIIDDSFNVENMNKDEYLNLLKRRLNRVSFKEKTLEQTYQLLTKISGKALLEELDGNQNKINLTDSIESDFFAINNESDIFEEKYREFINQLFLRLGCFKKPASSFIEHTVIENSIVSRNKDYYSTKLKGKLRHVVKLNHILMLENDSYINNIVLANIGKLGINNNELLFTDPVRSLVLCYPQDNIKQKIKTEKQSEIVTSYISTRIKSLNEMTALSLYEFLNYFAKYVTPELKLQTIKGIEAISTKELYDFIEVGGIVLKRPESVVLEEGKMLTQNEFVSKFFYKQKHGYLDNFIFRAIIDRNIVQIKPIRKKEMVTYTIDDTDIYFGMQPEKENLSLEKKINAIEMIIKILTFKLHQNSYGGYGNNNVIGTRIVFDIPIELDCKNVERFIFSAAERLLDKGITATLDEYKEYRMSDLLNEQKKTNKSHSKKKI